MAHLHLVVEVPDADPTLDDPESMADELIQAEDWAGDWRGAVDLVGAHWPWTRDQLRARLLQSFPGRTPDDGDVLVATTGELLDAVEALLNPPWEP